MIRSFVLCARLVVFPESDNGLLGKEFRLKVNREKSRAAPADGRMQVSGLPDSRRRTSGGRALKSLERVMRRIREAPPTRLLLQPHS